MDPELKAFGCLQKNCVENKWTTAQFTDMTYEELEENPYFKPFAEDGKTGILLTMISDEVEVREQYELYDISSFVADTGGFLGLLLGASLLSLFESMYLKSSNVLRTLFLRK